MFAQHIWSWNCHITVLPRWMNYVLSEYNRLNKFYLLNLQRRWKIIILKANVLMMQHFFWKREVCTLPNSIVGWIIMFQCDFRKQKEIIEIERYIYTLRKEKILIFRFTNFERKFLGFFLLNWRVEPEILLVSKRIWSRGAMILLNREIFFP